MTEGLSLKRKLWSSFTTVTTIFLLNAVWLSALMRASRAGLHSSPMYPTYLAFRRLLLEPITVIMFAIALSIWVLIIYRNSRRKPLSDRAKIGILVVLSAAVYGMLLLAFFP